LKVRGSICMETWATSKATLITKALESIGLPGFSGPGVEGRIPERHELKLLYRKYEKAALMDRFVADHRLAAADSHGTLHVCLIRRRNPAHFKI
jgi:hypothetical protein